MKTVFIYALKDPTTDEIRYVGKARNPKRRYQNHLISREKNHRTNWIKSLRFGGLIPALEVLDEVEDCDWSMWEKAWIQYYRHLGCNLTNGTAGGEGMDNPSPEVRKKMGNGNRGRVLSPEWRAKIRAAGLGRKCSSETAEKISVAHKGRKFSAEHCAKLSYIAQHRTFSEETKLKMRLSNLAWRQKKQFIQ